MIKRVIEKVQTLFKRKPRKPREPKRIPASEHHINQQLVPRSALRVCETLQKAGFRAYIVGGAVRDLLLDIAPKDFDVATNATPEQVKTHFRRAIIIGRRFRLVHVMCGAETVEVSVDGGRTFKPADLKDFSGAVKGQTAALVKVTFREALRALKVDAVVQNNPGALPYLSPGKNLVTVSAADPRALGSWGAAALSLILQAAVVYTPFLQRAFSTQALAASDWLRCVVVASSVLWLRELQKMVLRPGRAARSQR